MLLLALCTASCRTPLEQIERAAKKDPLALAKVCADCFPITERIVPGKTDTIRLPPQRIIERVPVILPNSTDTIFVDCPEHEVQVIEVGRVDTLIQENRAMVELLKGQLDKTSENLKVVSAELGVWKKVAKLRLWWVLGLTSLLAVMIYSKISGALNGVFSGLLNIFKRKG